MPEPYVYIGTSLPPLNLEEEPEMKYKEFKQLLKDNLSHQDYLEVEIYQRFFNMRNAFLMLKGEEIDPYGSLDKNQLENAMVETQSLPSYMVNFLRKYETKDDRLKYFPEVMAAYFRHEAKEAKGLLKTYLELERKIRLVSSVYRAKKLGWDFTKELQFEDPHEQLIAQLLAQKDVKEFVFADEFEEIAKILDQFYHKPLELHKALIKYRFDKLEEMVDFDVFSLDRIIAYYIQLILVEKWQKLDKQKGIEIVDAILKGSA